jgi:hypothetical protein
LFPAPFQKSVGATSQFIGYQAGNGVDGGGPSVPLGLAAGAFPAPQRCRRDAVAVAGDAALRKATKEK